MEIFLNIKDQKEADGIRELLINVPIDYLFAIKSYITGFSAGVEYERNKQCCNSENI